MNPRSLKTLSLLCAALCAVTIIATVYYPVAQYVPLPGAEALRTRWDSETRYRGTSGHRSHKASASGPIECGRLAMVAAALGAGALTFRRRAKQLALRPNQTETTL